jgi:hypothetical protein
MRRRRRATIEDLRLAIDCLPRTTRVAMLQGIRDNEIIVGAYSDSGGICPMLAAHRAGGRTNLIAFARAWDRFAFGGNRIERPRPATAREVLILRTHLESSLLEEEMPRSELGRAIAEHRELQSERRSRREPARAQRRTPRARPGDPDRSRELRHRPGWAWTRIVRRYDEYEWALEQVRALSRSDDPSPAEAASQAAADSRASVRG